MLMNETKTHQGIVDLADKASDAAHLLKLLANERRLQVLCSLAVAGEMTVNDLAGTVGLSQSALSQHLAMMRDGGIVTYRREGQTLHYRIADPSVSRVLDTLKDIYCP